MLTPAPRAVVIEERPALALKASLIEAKLPTALALREMEVKGTEESKR